MIQKFSGKAHRWHKIMIVLGEMDSQRDLLMNEEGMLVENARKREMDVWTVLLTRECRSYIEIPLPTLH